MGEVRREGLILGHVTVLLFAKVWGCDTIFSGSLGKTVGVG